MTVLTPGSLLLDRYLLKHALRPGLWTADDQELGASTLLEVYETAHADMDALRNQVRKFRAINHPHIARVIDLLHNDELAIFPLDVSGATLLGTQLKETGPLPHREVQDKIRPIIEGLCALHDEGVIHHDISTDNIITDDDGKWQLLPDAGSSQ